MEGGLGFRRLALFNKGLLAKQVWRIKDQSNSLLAKIFKARYFKHCDVMEAILGSNHSFIWRSILWGRELIQQGLKWRICKGDHIPACGKDWFGNKASIERSSCRIEGAKVSEYISSERTWIAQKVNDDFLPHEASEILCTTAGNEAQEDSRFWLFNKTGTYPVKSGYLVPLSKEMQEGASNHKNEENWWKKVWNLNVPPRIKIFMWKLSLDLIATEGNLAKHHVPLSPHCNLYGYVWASSIYAIFLCKAVKGNWSLLQKSQVS
ncbi:hypothetical protein ACS0TY_030007 [Phlomoides rotata]